MVILNVTVSEVTWFLSWLLHTRGCMEPSVSLLFSKIVLPCASRLLYQPCLFVCSKELCLGVVSLSGVRRMLLVSMGHACADVIAGSTS